MIAQQLHIYPGENIIGGSIAYQLDPVAGLLTTEGQVTVGRWILTKTLPLNSSNKVDPKLFLSASVKLNEKLDMGLFTLAVVSVSGMQAVCDVSVNANGATATGHAVINLSSEYISIVSINATGTQSISPLGSLPFELKVS